MYNHRFRCVLQIPCDKNSQCKNIGNLFLLNKTDLIEGHSLGLIENRIRKINPYAKIIHMARAVDAWRILA